MATDHNFKVKNGLNVEGAGLTIVADSSDSRITSGGEIRFRPEGSSSNKVRLTLNTVQVQGNVNTTTGYQVDGSNVIDTDGNWVGDINGGSITGTSLDINGGAAISGTLTFDGTAVYNALNLSNNNVIGVNNIQFADPGPNEGLQWSNIKIYEAPNDLTSNSAGNLQVVYGSTRRLTVDNTGIDVNGDVDVSGDINLTGDLNITGDVNSVSVTDLDVSDKTITLGVGQSAANSTGSGIVISGSNAELKWHNTNDRFEFNKPVHSDKFRTGNVQIYASGDDNHLHISAPSGVIPPSTTTSSNSSLGTSSYRWNGVYSAAGDFSGYVDIASRIRHSGDTDNYFSFAAADTQSFVTGNSTRLQITNTLVRLNQENNNQDFAVYSSNEDHCLYVDASTDRVGIGTDVPVVKLHLKDSGDPTILLEDTDSSNQVKVRFKTPTLEWAAGLHGGVDRWKVSKSSGFGTNDYLVINSGGDIGIGTDTPDEFGIGGSFRYLAVGGIKPGILNLVDDGTNGSYLQFGNAAGLRRASIHAENGSNLSFTLNSTNSGTSLTERLHIKGSNGNVGIGTNNPLYKLQVAGSVYSNAGSFFLDSGQRLKWGNSQQFIEANNSGPMEFGTGNAIRMVIENGGDIGIETTDPDAKLHVRGSQIIGEAGDTDQAPLFFEWVKSNTGSTGNGVWYKVANISLPDQGYSAIAFSATYVTGTNNYGNHDFIRRYENFITIVRNSGSSANNSPDSATVRGVTDDIRVYKTAAGTYELQARGNADNMEYHVEVKVFQGGANRITPVMDGDTAGTTSGGTAYGVATMVNGADGIIRHLGVTNSTFFNASPGSATAPSITFDNDTNTGLYRYSASEDRLGIATAGGLRCNFGSHGVESSANVYTSSAGAFRNYGGVWHGTTGVANNGFYFLNTANSNTTKAMELSHDGNVVFAGTLETTGNVTHNVSAASEEFMIKVTNDAGHKNALTLNHEYDRDIGIHFHTSGGDYEVWIDSFGDDSLILSPGTAGNPALELYQDKSAQFYGQVTIPVDGTNFILNSDTTGREAIDFRQNNTQKWTLDIKGNGDLDFVPKDGDLLKYNGNELATKSYVTGLGYLTSSSGLNASNLTSGTIPSARFPDNIFDSYRRDTIDSSSEDFNNYLTTGTYAVNNWSDTNDTVANGPTNSVAGDAYGWGVLRVTNWQAASGSSSGTGTYVLQEYWPHQTDIVYTRIMWNGSFTGWRAAWGTSNDGSGSGLDADLLDNLQSTSFLRSDAADTASGVITFSDRVDLHEIRSNTGQEVIINAGESASYATGQTGEYLYVNADTGFQVNVSPDNWSGGWAGRKTLTYDGTNGLVTSGGFSVDTSGNLSATTKSFDIEHPTKEGMRLRYGVLEGPENGVYVRGRTKGSLIQLPDHWTGLVHEDSITVQLTPIGKSSELYVKDISDNKVLVSNDTEYFYYIMAERKDVERFEVEYEV